MFHSKIEKYSHMAVSTKSGRGIPLKFDSVK
jgi:hypothetical protein